MVGIAGARVTRQTGAPRDRLRACTAAPPCATGRSRRCACSQSCRRTGRSPRVPWRRRAARCGAAVSAESRAGAKAEAPFTKCKSRGGKPPWPTVSDYSAQSLWSRVGHGRARGRRPPHPPPPPLGPLGAREASGRAPLRAPELPPPAVAREGNRPFRGARVLARPPPPRSSADGRPSRPSTPAHVRADRVRHAAGAARRRNKSRDFLPSQTSWPGSPGRQLKVLSGS